MSKGHTEPGTAAQTNMKAINDLGAAARDAALSRPTRAGNLRGGHECPSVSRTVQILATSRGAIGTPGDGSGLPVDQGAVKVAAVPLSALHEGEAFETLLTKGLGVVLHIPQNPRHGIEVAIEYPGRPEVELALHPDVQVRRAS